MTDVFTKNARDGSEGLGLKRSARWLLDNPEQAPTVLSRLSRDEQITLRAEMQKLTSSGDDRSFVSHSPRTAPDWTPFENQTSDVLVELLLSEPPMVRAVLISELSSQKGAAVLKSLNDDAASDLLLRMTQQQGASPTVINAIHGALSEKLATTVAKTGGTEHAADLLSQLPKDTADRLLKRVSRTDADSAHALNAARFGFEDLQSLSAPAWQIILEVADRDVLALALKSSHPALLRIVEAQMTTRAREDFQTRIAAASSDDATSEAEARTELMAIVRKLSNAGSIQLPKKRPNQIP